MHPVPDHDTVLVVDFGAQYAQLIARRVRECQVHSEIVPASMPAAQMLARKPKAIILSGGPSSVYAPGAPPAPDGLLDAGIPVLGICYGFQVMVSELGGTVARTPVGEYGGTELRLLPGAGQTLLDRAALPAAGVDVARGHLHRWRRPGFAVTASTAASPVAAVEDRGRGLFGVQFHPEVVHTPAGLEVLRRFLVAAGCRQDWTMRGIIDEQVARIAEQVGGARAICGLSGGVDSAVAAALVHRAIGTRLTCVFVDHGLLRQGEAEQVEKDFVAATGVDLHVEDAAGAFLGALAGVADPEEKRKIIGREFIRAFERATGQITARAGRARRGRGVPRPGHPVPRRGRVRRRERDGQHQVPPQRRRPPRRPGLRAGRAAARPVQGRGAQGRRANWGCRRRSWAASPSPALAWRSASSGRSRRSGCGSCGRRTRSSARSCRRPGWTREIWQCPVVLLADVYSVGVQGDGRSYGHPVVLRPVTSEDAMTADWARLPDPVLTTIATRITNEVPEINRVVLDVTSKPPGTIEWE